MIRPHVACGVALLAASLVLAVPRPASASASSVFGPSEDATSLVVKADAAHEAGRLAEAADLYRRAYTAMSAEEREALGAVVVGVALDDLKATWTATSDVTYAKSAADLLEQFERDAGGSLPDELAEHRAWVDEALADEVPADEPLAEDPTEDPAAAPDEPPSRRRDRAPSDREVVGPVLVGAGAAVAIGGIVMLAIGAPLGDKAEQSRDEALADPRFMEASAENQQIFMMQYADYVSAEKKRGTGLIAGGAVMLTVGVGLATYGIVRLVKHRRAASTTARVRQRRAIGRSVEPILGGLAF